MPIVQADELLYSVLARYSELMQYPNSQSTLENWFGRKTVLVNADLPMHLETLAQRTFHLTKNDAGYWMANHTLFPYFSAFHEAKRREKARGAMLTQGAPHWLLGLMASRVELPKTFHYCPRCSAHDRESIGFTYWRRTHQLPGVSVCLTHRVWLEESDVSMHPQVRRHKFESAELAVPRNLVVNPLPDNRASEVLIEIATRSASLLNNQVLPSINVIQKAYQHQLAKRQLATSSGRLRINKLELALQSHFGNELATLLGISLRATTDVWWLRLLRKRRTASHTLYHVLMQQFLEIDPTGLVSQPPPFGKKPWRCLNRTSAHFGKRVVYICEVGLTSNQRMPIGTFRCTCGFHYRRVGPDASPEDSWRIDRMAAYGSVWLDALRNAWNEEAVSLRELARRLGFDTATIRNQARKLGLSGRNSSPEPLVLPTIPDVKVGTLHQRRADWQNLRIERPKATTSQLRSEYPALYTWLYRNDREWLREHSPERAHVDRIDKRVNWEARDRELAVRIQAVVGELLKKKDPVVQLTRTRLSAELGHKSVLEQHIHRLPLSNAALTRLSETADAYAVRRIEVVMQQLLTSQRFVPRWQFMRLAGLRKERAVRPIVADALEKALWLLAPIEWEIAR